MRLEKSKAVRKRVTESPIKRAGAQEERDLASSPSLLFFSVSPSSRALC